MNRVWIRFPTYSLWVKLKCSHYKNFFEILRYLPLLKEPYTYLKRGQEVFDDFVSVCRRVAQQIAVCKTKTNRRGSAQLRTSCHIKPRSCTITKIQCPFLRFLKDFLEKIFLQYSRPRKCIGSREFQYIRDIFKGTLLLILIGVEADLTFPPSRLLLHTVKRLFGPDRWTRH